MPKWEICKLLLIERYERPAILPLKLYEKWVAKVYTPDGSKILYEGSEYQNRHQLSKYVPDPDRVNEYDALQSREKANLIVKILADGWEPIGANEFRRQIS